MKQKISYEAAITAAGVTSMLIAVSVLIFVLLRVT